MVDFCGISYTGLIKERKIGPITIKRLQILGVHLPDDTSYVQQELRRLHRKLSQRNIGFIQLGMVNEIVSFPNISHKAADFTDHMRDCRLKLRQHMHDTFGLYHAFRENMPESNIIYDVRKSDDELLQDMNSGCKERVKKALRSGIDFRTAKAQEYDYFYTKRNELSEYKGFTPLPKKDYLALIEYMKTHQAGEIFVAEKDGDLVAGSICIFDAGRVIYLYGFSNREYRNIGGHHFLKFEIFGRAREQGFELCDMLGGAPTWFPDHPLAGVSKFKESLGGTKIELYGNYDLVCNPILYRLMRWMYLRKKH